MKCNTEIILSYVDKMNQIIVEHLVENAASANISAIQLMTVRYRTYLSDTVGSRPKLGTSTSGRNHTCRLRL